MKFNTMIFDLDGTLLNTLDDLTDSVNHILSVYGYPKKEARSVRASLGNGAAHLLHDMLPDTVQGELFEQILSEYGAYYAAHCEQKTRPYDGLETVLAELKKRGIHMAIVSNKGDDAVKALAKHHFSGLVESAVGEREGIRRKPEPDSVLAAMEEMQAEKKQTLYVGDSEVDFETAKRAGIACALVTWGFRDRENLARLHPDYLIDTPQELLLI